MSRAFWALSLALAMMGCIEDQAVNRDQEANGDMPSADAAPASADGAMGQAGDGGPPMLMDPVPDGAVDARPPSARDAGMTMPPPPPTDDPDCNAFCERVDTCLIPECPEIEAAAGPGFCVEWCEGTPPGVLGSLGELACDTFVEVMYREAEDLREFCEGGFDPGEDPPADVEDQCEEICGFAAACGVPQRECRQFCGQLGDRTRACLERADDCGDLEECIEGGGDGPRDGPGSDRLRDACEPLCGRQAQCVTQQCAPGALPADYIEECADACVQTPPDEETFRTVFRGRCDEIIDDIRARDPAIDGRCDAEEEQACENLCENIVVPCGQVDQAECVAQCEGWDQANFRCVTFSEQCFQVNECFGDAMGQQMCQSTCNRIQSCLEEACPPRIISPEWNIDCTAGCLDDPPSQQETDVFLAWTCAEVRGWMYQNSRELRPLCEGNRDFRPNVEECTAFCDNVIGNCPVIGGRNFCLNGCASLTRDQYACAVERQGDCQGIATCLADPVEPPDDAP